MFNSVENIEHEKVHQKFMNGDPDMFSSEKWCEYFRELLHEI